MSTLPVSILLPVFNGGRFLEQQLDSIVKQSHGDFELLIYDDGSTDNSWSIIESFLEKDGRITAQRSQHNDGQLFGLSRLLERCRHQKVLFSDQDDIWDIKKIEVLVAALNGHSLVYGISHLIDEDGSPTGRTIFDFVGPPIVGRNRIDLLFSNTVSGHSVLADKSILDPGLFRVDLLYDRMIALAASMVSGITHEPEGITYHRLHGANQVNHSLLGDTRAARASRGEQLLRLWQALQCLSGMIVLDANDRRIFRKMALLVQQRITEFRSLYFVNKEFLEEMMACARDLTVDDVVLGLFRRKLKRLARGSLHPSVR